MGRLRGYECSLLLDLQEVCAIFYRYPRELATHRVATLRPRLRVLREEREFLSFFILLTVALLATDYVLTLM